MKSNHLKIILGSASLLVAFVGVAMFMTPEQQIARTPAWVSQLEQEIQSIDASTKGSLGVYVKKMGTNEEMNYRADRLWYFASTVKVPVAIALLQMVEEKKISLDQTVTLQKSDPVDGSGEVQFKRPGSKLKVSYLLEKMLTQSDSTATDLLIRLIGVDELNQRIHSRMGINGFRPFTTILQVRLDAFGNLHPNARRLTNQHFIDLKKHKSSSAKLKAIARQMKVPPSQLREKSIEDAFEKYYSTGMNSGSLRAYGQLLEKFASGQLLSPANTNLILKHMTSMTTGEDRLKAGLPKGVRFAQKTGTQVARICNVGIIYSPVASRENLIVTTCLEKFGSMADGERTLQKVGQTLAPLLRADSKVTSR